MRVTSGSRILNIDPASSIAKGGEADIFQISPTEVLKLYKQPDHPDLVGRPGEQDAAKFRLEEHQRKLPAFPTGLPPDAIGPLDLAYVNGKIGGYTMRFIDGANTLMAYSDMNFKQAVHFEDLSVILQKLHGLVKALHPKIILGDFNDLNVLVRNQDVFIVDMDATQFGGFLCYVFTQRFLDPLLARVTPSGLALAKPYVETADWYAFAIMVMNTLLSTGPYNGTTSIKGPTGKRIKLHERVEQRLTVFSPDVKYPTNAIPFDRLPDDLLHYLDKIFTKDLREVFPERLLQLNWTQCNCGIWHARGVCPECAGVAPAAVIQKIEVRGNVTSTNVFKTKGVIVFAAMQNNVLRYLWWEDGKFRRENGEIILPGKLDPEFRYRIQGDRTLIGKRNQLLIIDPGGGAKTVKTVDALNNLALFDANQDNYFWMHAGNLNRSHPLGHDAYQTVGTALRNQTLFWVGSDRGFGFYRAGNLGVSFVFDPTKNILNNDIEALSYSGQLVDSSCVFTSSAIWVMFSVQEHGVLKNHCWIYDHKGNVLARAEAEQDDGTWLGQIRGKTSMGNRLLSVTPQGIVRLKLDGGAIQEEAEFPDTSSFVHTGSHLFVNKSGLFVVEAKKIRLLTIS
jgi:hypothetical protein